MLNKPRHCPHTWDGPVKRKHLMAPRYSAAPSPRLHPVGIYATLFVAPPFMWCISFLVGRGWAVERLLKVDVEPAATQTQPSTGTRTTEAPCRANQLDVSALGLVSPLGIPGSDPLTMLRLDSDYNNRIDCRACSVGVPALINPEVESRPSWLVYVHSSGPRRVACRRIRSP